MRHIWSGDVDLCDGSLQQLYTTYIERRSFVQGLGRQGRWDISIDLTKLESEVTTDVEFITSGTECNVVHVQ